MQSTTTESQGCLSFSDLYPTGWAGMWAGPSAGSSGACWLYHPLHHTWAAFHDSVLLPYLALPSPLLFPLEVLSVVLTHTVKSLGVCATCGVTGGSVWDVAWASGFLKHSWVILKGHLGGLVG